MWKNEHKINGLFYQAILKRFNDWKNIIFNLSKNHSKSCIDYVVNDIKNKSDIISDFIDFINKSFNALDSQESYNKSEFITFLKDLYNDEKIHYSFKLKELTISNIISRWKSRSLKFTKYSALENKYDKYNNLILLDYISLVIFTSNKKNPIPSENFIWTAGPIIEKCHKYKHLFIDGTF